MSMEKQARRALYRVMILRVATELAALPRDLCRVMESLFEKLSDLFDGISQAIFYAELDAARRYTLLTGSDLGVATGFEERYSGMGREAAEQARLEAAVEDDDDDDD
jgi:hypothetical protein